MQTLVETDYYIERRLIEKVKALQHLSDASWIPQLNIPIDQELFIGILGLQNGIDPLTWLKNKYADLISRVLLWTVLDRLKTFVQGVHLSQRSKHPQLIISISKEVDLSEGIEPLLLLDNTYPTTVSPELLLISLKTWISIFQREDAGEYWIKSFNDDLLQKLGELFQLPPSNVLQWIKDRHSKLAAFETLQYLIKQTRPPVQVFNEEKKNQFYPKRRNRSEGVTLSLHQIALGAEAFIVILKARIPEKLLQKSCYPGMQIAWQGVEHIEDDLGAQYVIYHRLEEGEKRWWWHDKSLRLLCYPAIQATATEIVITSKVTSFSVINPGSGEQYQIQNQLQIGDILWKWALNR